MDGEAVTQCLNLPPDLIVVFEHPWLTLFFGAVGWGLGSATYEFVKGFWSAWRARTRRKAVVKTHTDRDGFLWFPMSSGGLWTRITERGEAVGDPRTWDQLNDKHVDNATVKD